MGTNATRELWGQALAIENKLGDSEPEVLARRIDRLRDAGEIEDAEFWSQVAGCLTDMHAIRLPGACAVNMDGPRGQRQSAPPPCNSASPDKPAERVQLNSVDPFQSEDRKSTRLNYSHTCANSM